MRRSIAALALAVVLPTGALVAPAARADVVVKPGETLSEIAERNGVSLQRLMQVNGIRNPDVVVAGTRLVLPGAPRSSQSGGSGGGGSASGSVTVREGETLSEIADRYGTSVERLMQLNGIRNADMVAAGTRLTLPSRPRPAVASTIKVNPKARKHVVQSGETLSHISDAYGIPVERLISLNKITDPNMVVAGTNLTLQAPPPPKPRPVARKPKPAATAVASKPKPAAKPATPIAVQPKPAAPVASKPATAAATTTTASTSTTSTAAAPVASKPVAAKPATTDPSPASAPVTASTSGSAPAKRSTTIAKATPTTASAVTTSSSAAASVSKVAPATTTTTVAKATRSTAEVSPAATTAPTTATTTRKGAAVQVSRTPSGGPDWRSYGPMQVDWANWRPMGGSFVAPSLGRDGKPHYLAINCGARKLNATSQSGQWRTWDSPQNDEEQRLVSDLCSSKGG